MSLARAGDDPHTGSLQQLPERDDDLAHGAVEPRRGDRPKPAHERHGRVVVRAHARPQTLDPLLPGETRELVGQTTADAAALPLVDDGERNLGLCPLRFAHEARDPHGAAGRSLDRSHGLPAAAADVDEAIELPGGQGRLRPEKAEPARPLGEPAEDLEHGVSLAAAETTHPDRRVGHSAMVPAGSGPAPTASPTAGIRQPALRSLRLRVAEVLGLTQQAIHVFGEEPFPLERASRVARPFEQLLVAPKPDEPQVGVA